VVEVPEESVLNRVQKGERRLQAIRRDVNERIDLALADVFLPMADEIQELYALVARLNTQINLLEKNSSTES
jgi:hypothetical protein